MNLNTRQNLALRSYQAGFHLIFPLGLILGLPLWLARRKRRLTVLPRLGMQQAGLPTSRPGPVWIHALSIGEMLSSVTLVRELRRGLGEIPLVYSVSTLAAREMAEERLSGDVDQLFYFPYDLIPCVARVMNQVRPAALVVVETDIWPGFMHEINRRRLPAFLVNGRLSPQTYRSFLRWRSLFEPALTVFDTIFPQSEREARRFCALGVGQKKIGTAGNLKFDVSAAGNRVKSLREIRRESGITEHDRVWIAGSTHPGEEKFVLAAHRHLLTEHPGLKLILVPRHPHRAEDVKLLCEREGLTAGLFTAGPLPAANQVLIVDAMGRLSGLYRLAEAAFVGGSLVNKGGQNPIEPAAAGKPVLFGPHMNDFPDAAAELLENNAAFQVKDQDRLLESLRWLLTKPESARQMGSRGEKWVESHRGATERVAERVIERIKACRRGIPSR